MDSKKFFILAYARQNLGDDLFIYMLLRKYPEIQFFINIEKTEHAKLFENYENVTIYQDVGRKLTKENANEYDGYIYIGGSIFMEGIGVNYTVTEQLLSFMQECKKQEIPFHYVSSNFGPYETEGYLNLTKEIIQNCASVHFRDKYSSDLFSEVSTVHYAPDLAFTYIPEKTEKKANSVGISLIDLNIRPKLIAYIDNYYDMLVSNIKDYINQGKSVTLFSFCKHEGDERAIEEMVKRLPINIKEKVNILNYDGDIEYFLREYSKMEYVICSRFHAMILSAIMNQKCKILSYSDKFDNVINDLGLFTNKILHFDEICSDTKISLSEFQEVDMGKIQLIRKEATKQLEGVEESLNSMKDLVKV